MMFKAKISIIIFTVILTTFAYKITDENSTATHHHEEEFKIVSRESWNARQPREVESFPGPIPYIFIHHSYIPSACFTYEDCCERMRAMQDMHQLDNKWNDIGYSFAVGGDGQVYEGRGFNIVGAHAPPYNNKSVGICMIGDWTTTLPPKLMLDRVKEFIGYSVKAGFVSKDYKLLGHRQARATECPGQKLFDEIKTWKNFDPTIWP